MGPSSTNPTYQSLLGILQPQGSARSTSDQSKHDNLIKKQVYTYQQNGYYRIQADHISWPGGAPLEVGGHIPDIVALDSSNRVVICEVETGESLSSQHTRDQLTAFRRVANDSGGYLHLVVPTGFHDAARQTLNSWGITVEGIWHG